MNRQGLVGLTVAAMIVTAVVVAAAQRGAPPPVRDTPQRLDVGKVLIGGTVVTDDAAGTPIRRATVSLRSVDTSSSRATLTDDRGRFAFPDLPAGRFTVWVYKPGYIETSYGATTPRSPALTLVLADGQQSADLVVKMARGAVITGRVTNDSGEPAFGSAVGAAEQIVVNGQPNYRRAGIIADVDRDGVYRIYGLPAGTYIVGVTPSPPAAPTGGFPRVATAAEVQWAMRGRAAAAGAAEQAPKRGAALRRAVIYYPATMNADAATTITLTAGEERTGIDMVSRLVASASLDGTVLTADSRAAQNVSVLPIPLTRQVQVGYSDFPPRATVTPQGRFSVSGLLPGRYLLTARAMSGSAPLALGRGGLAPVSDLWAQTEIEVAEADLTNLALTLMPGMTVSGRIAFDGAGPPPTDVTGATVSLRSPPDPQASVGGVTVAPYTAGGTVSADGTFMVSGIAPGPYLVTASMAGAAGRGATPQRWVVRSATATGRNVLDEPLQMRAGTDVTDVVVTFTDRIAELSGTLKDRTGKPAPSYFVVIFGTNPSFWTLGSRWIRPPVRPASDGRFTITNLTAGEYYVAALTDVNEWNAPANLQQIVPMALKLTVAEGEKKVQDLVIASQ